MQSAAEQAPTHQGAPAGGLTSHPGSLRPTEIPEGPSFWNAFMARRIAKSAYLLAAACTTATIVTRPDDRHGRSPPEDRARRAAAGGTSEGRQPLVDVHGVHVRDAHVAIVRRPHVRAIGHANRAYEVFRRYRGDFGGRGRSAGETRDDRGEVAAGLQEIVSRAGFRGPGWALPGYPPAEGGWWIGPPPGRMLSPR